MRIYDQGTYRDATPEEITDMQQQATIAAAREKSRPLTVEEVYRMLIAAQINTLAVDDTTAVRMTAYYPEWAASADYAVDYKVQYKNRLYRCRQEHTSQVGWEPDVTPAMWEVVDVTHAGTLDDPIPAAPNMQYDAEKYYIDDGVIYLCTRDTGQAIAQLPGDLIGVYFTVVGG